MEYISLSKLVNKYPSIGSYVSKVVGIVRLNGIYSLKNFIDLKISPINNIKLDDIQSVDNTTFQFVLGIKNKSSETTPFKYFTSTGFFKKLNESVNEPNPYFVSQALKKEFIVEYSLEADIEILKDLSKLEKEDNVELKNHIWFKGDGNVDYKKLVQFIDFVVSTPKPLDTENLGVIPITEILSKVDFKIEKLKLTKLPKSETPKNGGSLSSGNNNNSGAGSGGVGENGGGSSYDTTPSSGTSTRDTNDGSGGGSGSGRGGSSDGGSGNTSGGNTGGGLGMGDGRGSYESGFDTSSGDFNSINNLG